MEGSSLEPISVDHDGATSADSDMQTVPEGVNSLPDVSMPECNGTPDDGSGSSGFMTDFSSLADSPTDIILDTGDRQFFCHKNVLCRESVWFQAMVESGMKESRSERVHLSETDSEHFQLLLRYFYTGELKLTQSNIHGLTELSSMYQASKALKLCCEFLISIIEDDLCLSLMRMANFLMLADVYNRTRRHALWHFSSVSRVEDFFLAPAPQLLDYLQDPYLNIDSELDVFVAAAEWYHAQEKPCEVTDLEEFFADTVNFHLLTEEEVRKIRDFPVVQKDKELAKFVAFLGQEDVIARLKTKVISSSHCKLLGSN